MWDIWPHNLPSSRDIRRQWSFCHTFSDGPSLGWSLSTGPLRSCCRALVQKPVTKTWPRHVVQKQENSISFGKLWVACPQAIPSNTAEMQNVRIDLDWIWSWDMYFLHLPIYPMQAVPNHCFLGCSKVPIIWNKPVLHLLSACTACMKTVGFWRKLNSQRIKFQCKICASLLELDAAFPNIKKYVKICVYIIYNIYMYIILYIIYIIYNIFYI